MEFSDPVVDRRGHAYIAHVEGELRPDGMWEGSVVFTPVQSGERTRTDRETVQRDASDLQYWAAGLTYAYLEGALERAQDRRRLESRGEWREERGDARTARFHVSCADDRIPAELLGTFALEPGTTRELPDGSRIRYTGTRYGGAHSAERAHTFELEYRGERAAVERWLGERIGDAGLAFDEG
jgi:hypothetical protein